MNYHDLHVLQNIRGYPSLTITLPTHRTSPDNRQDPIRVRNLVAEATDRLQAEFTKREIEPVLTRLEGLVADLDYRHTLDGLALFVNSEFARAHILPFTLKERILVDEGFAIRDLVYALNRSQRYWVLVLGEKPTRLFEGVLDTLIEVEEGGFPFTHTGPGGEAPLPGGFGIKKSAYRDERHRQFFRQVDAGLRPFLLEDPLPLVVVGVDRYLSFFNEVSQHKDSVIGSLTGSHSRTSTTRLGRLVWPLVKAGLDTQRQKYLEELGLAVSQRKFAATIEQVWRVAQEGRGRLLLVEKDFHFPAKVDASGLHLEQVELTGDAEDMDDAVDEIVKTVLDKQGKVAFVENGSLDQYQRIAMILRY
jgi:hypothetical protein